MLAQPGRKPEQDGSTPLLSLQRGRRGESASQSNLCPSRVGIQKPQTASGQATLRLNVDIYLFPRINELIKMVSGPEGEWNGLLDAYLCGFPQLLGGSSPRLMLHQAARARPEEVRFHIYIYILRVLIWISRPYQVRSHRAERVFALCCFLFMNFGFCFLFS